MKHLIIIYLLICLDTKLVRANNLPFEIIKNPASTNSSSSNLTSFGEEFILSWIELDSKKTARLKMSVWNGLRFDKNILIEESKNMFVNWADIPSIIEAPSGDLYAQWLDRISSKNYSYGVRISRSINQGKNWKKLGWLHDDKSETEHGFVSLIQDGNIVRAFWLDGRMMVNPTGKMMLRTAVIDGDHIKGEIVLDNNVCTCCPTSAAQLSDGPIVIYRDRSPKEIRDISFSRRRNNNWTEPSTLKKDNWLIPGCPVNGASLAANNGVVAISRYTVTLNKAKVILRLFNNGRNKSGKEIVLDENNPIGRCVTVCSQNMVYTIWIGLEKNQTVLRLAEVSPSGDIIRKKTLTTVKGNRSSGTPRAIVKRGYLWLSWTDANNIRLGKIKIDG